MDLSHPLHSFNKRPSENLVHFRHPFPPSPPSPDCSEEIHYHIISATAISGNVSKDKVSL